MLWEHEPQATVSTAFSSSLKLSRVLYNSIETRSACFFISFRKQHDEKKGKQQCKLSLLTSSLRQQRALVLCLQRVIQTRFLSDQRECSLRTVF